MEPIVWVALIGMSGVIATGLVSPILLSRLNSAALLKAKEKDAAIAQAAREEDWRRQDAVAEKLAEPRHARRRVEAAARRARRPGNWPRRAPSCTRSMASSTAR